jgi:hypothetical protein
LLPVVNPVARTIIDPQLGHAFSDRLNVSRIPGSQTLDSHEYTCAGADVTQPVEPPGEDLRLANLQ